MSTTELLSKLRCLNVKLWVDGDRLRYSGPAEALTSQLLDEIGSQKAGLLAFLHDAHASEALVPLARGRERDSSNLPLSFAQQRLWFLAQLSPGNTEYNIVLAFELIGALDVAAFAHALEEVVRRHEVLRTTIEPGELGPVQRVSTRFDVPVAVEDFTELPRAHRTDRVRELIREEQALLFDLRADLMLRVRLARFEDDEHVVIITMHHVASDGWSLGVLARELMTLYDAFRGGWPSPLPELPLQYADFALWQRNWLQGAELERRLSYWRNVLADAPVLELPTDRPRPPVQTFNGAEEARLVGQDLWRRMKSLVQGHGATEFMGMLAAFAVVLQRYTRQDDIVVGSPVANRNRAELEGLIGFFVNMLVLRIDLSGDPTFLELLDRVRQVALDAYEHQDVPFEKLVGELAPARDLSRNPLFQVTFALQNTPAKKLVLPGLTLNSIENPAHTTRFDLETGLWEGPNGLTLRFCYNSDLFDAQTVRRIANHFGHVLRAVLAAPQRCVSELGLLPDDERSRLLTDWNRTAMQYPGDATISQLFEEQVERTPDALAVDFEGEALSYSELNRRANRLAHYLREQGVGPEVCVGLCVQRSLQMAIGMLGIMKAGGAYVALDPAYPKARLEFMLEDTAAPVLLVQGALGERLPVSSARTIRLDAEWGLIEGRSDTNPDVEMAAHNLAYVIYTSGSTGRPKGVAIEHRNAVALISWAHTVFSEEELSGVLASTSISFDLSVFEIFVPLACGGKVILAENALRLPALPAAAEVTLINSVPSVMAELLRQANLPPSVRTVNLAGEPLSVDLVNRIYDQASVCAVYDLYGPSECTTYSTYALRERDGPATVGRPIANTTVFLLDHHQQPVPVGVPGEIYIGGDGVARGYLNRPQLSGKRFLRDPFSPTPGGRLYRTGDLARYRDDGSIVYLGRADRQVKLRGYRIELGEVESILDYQVGVSQSAVLCREDEPGKKRLVAYLVPEESAHAPTAPELCAVLREQLPEFMVPSAFVFLEAMPLNANGKVDRAALPPSEMPRPSPGTASIPRTAVERTLVELWRELLNRDSVGVDDNFFELGGNSLLLMRLHSKMARELDTELPVINLFRYSTVRMLAAHCTAVAGSESGPSQARRRAMQQREAIRRTRPRPA